MVRWEGGRNEGRLTNEPKVVGRVGVRKEGKRRLTMSQKWMGEKKEGRKEGRLPMSQKWLVGREEGRLVGWLVNNKPKGVGGWLVGRKEGKQ